MKFRKTLLFLLLIPLVSFSTHKYYLSLTQLNFKNETKSIQIIINVFLDDIETALNSDYTINLQLTTEKEIANNDLYFEKYLKEKLDFKVDGIHRNFNYIGKEFDGDLIYFYLEIENIHQVHTIDIVNNILTNHFPEQQNLIKSKVGTKHKSVLLSKDENSAKLKYH
jgi:hypothetical protein